MALRTVRKEQDEILRKHSKTVGIITDRILTLLDDMADTMYENEGVGLAAVQVGVLKRIAVIDTDEEDGLGLVELINPEVLEQSGSQTESEGCLSLPGKSAKVERPTYIKIKALNRHGKEVIIEAHDFFATAICHELDHMEGILFTDKAIIEEESETEETEETQTKE